MGFSSWCSSGVVLGSPRGEALHRRTSLFGQEPGKQTTKKTGRKLAVLSLATKTWWTDANEQRHEKTEWHRVVIWNGLAEYVADKLKKGDHVYVVGTLVSNVYDKEVGKGKAPPTANNRPVIALEINENPFAQRMVLWKKNILVADTAEDADWRETEYFGNPRCWIGVPLVTRDRVHGLLSLSSDEPRLFTQEHFRLAKLLALPLAVAIHTARLYEWTYIYSEERKQLLRKINPSLSN